jgi:chromate transporter
MNPYTLKDLIIYFLKLGTWGFGGPVALVGYMHRDLVENKKWISEEDYREGLALAQLAPGPLAAQLAIYIGYVHYRIRGATIVGLAFVLPSFLMVLVIAYTYVLYGGLSWMQAVFYGVGAAVIGIIIIGSYKLTSKVSDVINWMGDICCSGNSDIHYRTGNLVADINRRCRCLDGQGSTQVVGV